MDWKALTSVGIIEQRAGRTRISPRFLAHAEGTYGRMSILNPHAPLPEVLHSAIGTWKESTAAHRIEATELLAFMQDRNQLGLLQRGIAA
ncbi:MAG: hypothetical protein ACPHK8_04750 [Thermoplasmatota archaeon]